MLIRFALLLVSLPLLAHGAEGLYQAYRSRTQAHITCEQFRRARPASGWLRLTGCEVDYVRAGYRDTRGRVTELLFPLRPAGASLAQPSALVVSTRDPALLAIVERELAGPAQDQEAFLVMMLQVVTAMGVSRQIEGLTRSNLEMLRVRGSLGAIKAPLEKGFTVLDVNARPRPLFPAVETVVGAMALFLFTFLSTVRRRHAPESPIEPEEDLTRIAPSQRVDDGALEPPLATEIVGPPVVSHVEPPVVSSVEARPAPLKEFRHLMLVNLPPHSPPSALEGAPPLGLQSAVRSALTRVLPSIAFSSRGIGHFTRPDYEIVVDPGSSPEVWTATIDVTGEAAGAALKQLVTQTGWQVYAPKLGRFLTSEDLEITNR